MYDIVVQNLVQLVKDVIVDTLIIEEDRPDHIAKHNIIIDEVLEVLTVGSQRIVDIASVETDH
jgi:hypothetical protein